MSCDVTGPLAIDLYCGLGGWTEGLLAEGYDVIGFDNKQHVYGEHRYPAQLVIQDVLTLHGKQFKDAALIVASPPCQEYSYMAMPWSRAKAIAAEYRSGKRDVKQLTALFDACFRIQREACQAAGRHIPLVVENVRGAIPWVGRSRWNFGSFHLWGDVPALMPMVVRKPMKNTGGSWFRPPEGRSCYAKNCPDGRATMRDEEGNFHGHAKNPGFRFDGSGRSMQTESVDRHIKGIPHKPMGHWTNPEENGTKQAGISGVRANGKGDRWFQDGAATHGSKPSARKAASAMIARIPLTLARYIARTYRP